MPPTAAAAVPDHHQQQRGSSSSSDHHQQQRGSSSSSVVSMALRGRSVLSLRRNQVVSMDSQVHDAADDIHGVDLFQSHVTDRLLSLVPQSSSELQHQLPSLPFLHKLLDAFLSCEDEFKSLLVRNLALISKSSVDRLLTDLIDRAVKSLDICNEITQSLQSVRHWNRDADIAASALRAHGTIAPGEGQLNRARKALAKLLTSPEPAAVHHEAAHSNRRSTERGWSFLSRNSSDTKQENPSSSSSSRSLSRTWSAGKQLQAISANLAPPRGDAGGLALAVYTMSSVLVFVMWALVASFSGGSSASSVPVGPPRQLAWAPAMIGLQERILEEWRRRGRKGGVLAEVLSVERCGKEMVEAVAVCEASGRGTEVVGRAGDLREASQRLEEGLGPFERQLREVFHRIVRSREEVMRCLEQSTRSAPPFFVL